MRRAVVLVAAIALAVAGVARADDQAESRTVTLTEALDLLQSQNPDTLSGRLQVEAAEAERLSARVFPNPSLSFDANNFAVGHTTPRGLSTGETVAGTVRIDQPLILWGKRGLRVAGAEAAVGAAQEEARDVSRQLRAAVKVAFYDSLHDERQLIFVLDNQKRYQEIVSLNQRRFESGDISEAEFRKIELEQLKYLAQVEDAQRGVVESRALLGRLLGIGSAVTATGKFAAPPVAIDGADLMVVALANRPDWAALQRERDQTAAALELARRERYPDVSVGLDYSRSQFVVSGDNRNSLGFGFTVPLPLFNQNQAEIAKANVALRQADTMLTRLRLDIAQEVQTTVAAYRAAQRMQQTFENGYLDRAKITVDAAEASYRIGAASLIELLDAERTYTSTQTDYLDTVFAARSTLTHLERAIGKDLDGN
jgi:cobalt-zinc-cadmium efflux system outer membrane protein